MHNLMRDRYWNMFYDARYRLFYYTFYKQQCDIRTRWIKIFLSIVSCSGVAGWAIWKSIPGLWAFVIALSQIVSVIYEYLPFAKESTGIEYLLPELEMLTIDIASDWNRIDETDDKEIIEKISFYEKRMVEIESRFLSSSAFLYNKKAIQRANDECDKFFKAYSTTQQEGVETEQNSSAEATASSKTR